MFLKNLVTKNIIFQEVILMQDMMQKVKINVPDELKQLKQWVLYKKVEMT